MQQPDQLTIVKVVQNDLLTRLVYARDQQGHIWWRVEGLKNARWELAAQWM